MLLSILPSKRSLIGICAWSVPTSHRQYAQPFPAAGSALTMDAIAVSLSDNLKPETLVSGAIFL